MQLFIFLLTAGFASSISGSPKAPTCWNNTQDTEQARKPSEGYKIVCYFTNWAVYRPEEPKFVPAEVIDPFLCTHIIYAFAKLKDGHVEPTDLWQDIDKGQYKIITGFKEKNPKLKVFLSIGGHNSNDDLHLQIYEHAFSRKKLIYQSFSFLRQHDFDGLDVDLNWDQIYTTEADKRNFAAFVKEYNEISYAESQSKPGKSRLELSVTVPTGLKDNIQNGNIVAEVSRYIDFILVKGYDLRGSWGPGEVGLHSPMCASPSDDKWDAQLSVHYAVGFWRDYGIPSQKLILGIPAYGRSFTLEDPSRTGIMSPSKGPGRPGRLTKSSGVLAFSEICELLNSGGTRHYQVDMQVPYAVHGDQWVGYDDEESVRHKMNYIKAKGLGGAMVWEMSFDDFSGAVCQGGFKFPLVGTMREELLGIPREKSDRQDDEEKARLCEQLIPLIQKFPKLLNITVCD